MHDFCSTKIMLCRKMISWIVVYHMYTNTNTRGLCCSGMNAFINFLTSRGERDTILTMLTLSQRTMCLVVFKISVGRDPKILTATTTVENSTLCPNMAETQLSACMVQCQPSTDSFSKSSNSQPIFSGHDILHTPASYPIWGLLWQWWLSYPLRLSVKLYPMAMHLNS